MTKNPAALRHATGISGSSTGLRGSVDGSMLLASLRASMPTRAIHRRFKCNFAAAAFWPRTALGQSLIARGDVCENPEFQTLGRLGLRVRRGVGWFIGWRRLISCCPILPFSFSGLFTPIPPPLDNSEPTAFSTEMNRMPGKPTMPMRLRIGVAVATWRLHGRSPRG